MLTDKEYSSSTEYTLETYQYDKAGRMARQTQTDHNNSTLTQLTHYYIGEQRVEKLSGENIGSRYYYTGGALLFTAAVYNHERTTENILALDGQVIASKRFEGTFDGNYYFYYYDIRGSVSGIFGPNSEVVKDYQYSLYGEITEGGNADFENEIGFTGSITDETGLNYMHARFYNSNTGRFISEDSFGGYMAIPWSQNLYSYCGNNPVNMIDPTGHFSTLLSALGTVSCGGLPKSGCDCFRCVSYWNSSSTTQNRNTAPYDTTTERGQMLADKASGSSATIPKPNTTHNNTPAGPADNAHEKNNNVRPFILGELPSSEGGPPNGSLWNKKGDVQRWYDENGRAIKDRHYTDHKKPKYHPDVPHDHDWGYNDKGAWSPGEAYPSPKEDSTVVRDVTTGVAVAAGTAVAAYGTYLGIKWVLAIILAPATCGGSLAAAAITP